MTVNTRRGLISGLEIQAVRFHGHRVIVRRAPARAAWRLAAVRIELLLLLNWDARLGRRNRTNATHRHRLACGWLIRC
jgi:hypothetical protein